MTILLTLKDRQSDTKQYSFSGKDIIIAGRKETNDIVISHPTVSSHHFKITREKNDYYIEDLNSTNGTFLNGMQIKRAKIENQDMISVSIYTINIKITNLNIPKAEISVIENPVDERKKFIISKTITFIGTIQKADIPAKPKNIFYPISDFSLAIKIKGEKYHVIPINDDQTKLNSSEIKKSLELKTDDIIEVGITKFMFKYSQ